MNVGDLSSNLDKLRKMFDMLEQKSVLMQLLDVSVMPTAFRFLLVARVIYYLMNI
jgi:hypothetical protein